MSNNWRISTGLKWQMFKQSVPVLYIVNTSPLSPRWAGFGISLLAEDLVCPWPHTMIVRKVRTCKDLKAGFWFGCFGYTNDNFRLLRRHRSPRTANKNWGSSCRTYSVFLRDLPAASSSKAGESLAVVRREGIVARNCLFGRHALRLLRYYML